MVIKTALVTAGLLAMSNLPSFGQVRDWLAPLPGAGEVAADVLTFKDNSINFGPRVKVRVLRPEGAYEIDNSAPAPAASEPAASQEGAAEPR